MFVSQHHELLLTFAYTGVRTGYGAINLRIWWGAFNHYHTFELYPTTMPKQNFDRIFFPYTLAVEKKINKLATFMESLEDDTNISEFKIKILMTHADTLLGNMERMEADWDSLRDGILQQDYSRVHISSDSLFSKILKKPFMVHKKWYLIWMGCFFSLDEANFFIFFLKK